MTLHVVRRELAARWLLAPAAVAVGALAMLAIQSIGHVRGDADNIMNGTWVGTLVVSTIVGMSLLGEELSNSRLSFYFARPFTPQTIFAGKLAAGILLALVMQIAIVTLVALALPALSWRGSAFADRHVLAVGGERVLATVGCTLLGMAASIALGSKSRWFVLDALGICFVGVIITWFTLRLEPDPFWLPEDSIRGVGEKALFRAAAFGIAVIGLAVSTRRALLCGRTDRMRAHRVLSTTLWPVVVPAVIALAALGEVTRPPLTTPPVLASGAMQAPVATSMHTRRDDELVPYLFLVDSTGSVRVGAASSWSQLDAGRVRLSKPIHVPADGGTQVNRFTRARYLERLSGALRVAAIPYFETTLQQHFEAVERARAHDRARTRTSSTAHMTAIEREYTVRRLIGTWLRGQDDILAMAAGSLGHVVDRAGPGYPRRHGNFQPWSSRSGMPMKRAMVVAAPGVNARTVLKIAANTNAAIAVSYAGKLRPLQLDLDGPHYDGWPPWTRNWVEVRVSRTEIVVEAVPDAAIRILDSQTLVSAIARARASRNIEASDRVDLLVDSDVDMQRFVDILEILDAGGVNSVIGQSPTLELREHRIPSTFVGEVYEHGREKTWIIRSRLAPVNRCYAASLERDPTATGTVRASLVLDVEGAVTSASGTGSDPELATCVAAALTSFAFGRALELSWGPRMLVFELSFSP